MLNYPIPQSDSVATEKLTQIFNKTTNSYKYLWFLSLLNCIDFKNTRSFTIEEIIFEMLKISWYPINYYRLSFGVQDKIIDRIRQCQSVLRLNQKSSGEEILNSLRIHRADPEILQIVETLSKYVPYRLLTPWFSHELEGLPDVQKNSVIEKLAAEKFQFRSVSAMYKFDGRGGIEVECNWYDYLKKNSEILRGFTLWNFVKYLERLNPNVPSIAEKLFEPKARNLNLVRSFWRQYFECKAPEPVYCIYSGEPIDKDDISLDHYIPWGFVTHDLIWNICPTIHVVNSSKNDSLPDHTKYLDKFTQLQYEAFSALGPTQQSIKVMEQYCILFNDSLVNIRKLTPKEFIKVLANTIQSLDSIASNLGFSAGWCFRGQNETKEI